LSKRNNGARTAAPQAPPTPQRSSGALNFTKPTEFVELPTEGKFYPEGHPLHLVKEVEINYMSAREEDILTSQALITRGVMLDRLIGSVLVDKSIDVDTLYPGDKDAIIVAARSTGYGPEYVSNVQCGSCGARHEHVVDLAKLPIKQVPEDISLTPSGTFTVMLPITGFMVEMRILDSRAQKYLDNTRAANKKNNLPERNRTDLLKMIVVSVNSVTDRAELDAFIDSMPAQDSRTLKKSYDRVSPSLLMEQRVECPNCQTVVVREVPLGVDFFWPS
tara:strand:- start:1227 stop:2054 length:828 start_codon:yes stop_codon:yes gene_type:complete